LTIPHQNFAVSQRLAYNKGFFVWDMLARTIGRNRFRTVMRTTLARHAFEDLSWEELKRAISVNAGREFNWFFAQWFERAGAPDWFLTWKLRDNRVVGVVKQSPPYYRARVDVRLVGIDGQWRDESILINGAETRLDFVVTFQVRSLVLDPHYQYLHWTAEYRALAKALLPLTHAQFEPAEEVSELDQHLAHAIRQIPVPDVYGAHFLFEYQWGLNAFVVGDWAKVKSHYEAALASPTRIHAMLPDIYFQLAYAAKQLNDETMQRWAAESAISADAAAGINTGVSKAARTLLPP
jgi:hypothetical protein